MHELVAAGNPLVSQGCLDFNTGVRQRHACKFQCLKKAALGNGDIGEHVDFDSNGLTLLVVRNENRIERAPGHRERGDADDDDYDYDEAMHI